MLIALGRIENIKNVFMDIVYGFLFLLLSFVEYKFYTKWRKFKK